MTTAHNGHDQQHATDLPYSGEEIEGFHREDIHAAKMIVGLMTGIFTIGIGLYVLVALAVTAKI